jgi:hypothetical protein
MTMEHAIPGRTDAGEVFVCMSREDARHVLDALAAVLAAETRSSDAQEVLSSFALFIRDYLGETTHIPAVAGPTPQQLRNAA